ncbi:MAG: 4'-phosphopantetheinyl transferase superfamily protein [Clostridia bacterium]|nr:4'-phosphopantetheinyl transferase superfamily protein [Clostridia bacterium]NCC45232.1 4'-phosphopantetheinyl transferase superfamily protein [Clostridia bacterium]
MRKIHTEHSQDVMCGWTKLEVLHEKNKSLSTLKKEAGEQTRCGRELLSQLVWEMYQISLKAEEEPIQVGVSGKPYLREHEDIFFNISHSGEYVACVVADVPVGIDIQHHAEGRIEKIANKILSPSEMLQFEQEGRSAESFYHFWTKKESYLKFTGEGISCELDQLLYEKCRFYDLNLWNEYTVKICTPDDWEGKIIVKEVELSR